MPFTQPRLFSSFISLLSLQYAMLDLGRATAVACRQEVVPGPVHSMLSKDTCSEAWKLR